jgi:hypothetical protein
LRLAGRNANIYKPKVPTTISTRSEKKYNFERNSLVAFVFGVTAPRRTVAPEGVRLGEGRIGRRNGLLSSRVVARSLQRLRVGEGRVGRRNGLVLSGVCVVMTKRCEGKIRGVNVRAGWRRAVGEVTGHLNDHGRSNREMIVLAERLDFLPGSPDGLSGERAHTD